jgi:hypothetical protein
MAESGLILSFASQDVLKLDIPEQCLRFGDEVVDRPMTLPGAVNDDLGGTLCFFRLGDGKWNHTFFLLRTLIRDGSGYVSAGTFIPEIVLEHPELVAGLHREFAVPENMSSGARPPVSGNCDCDG